MEYPLWKQFSNIEEDWHLEAQFLFLYDMTIFQKLKSLKFSAEKKIKMLFWFTKIILLRVNTGITKMISLPCCQLHLLNLLIGLFSHIIGINHITIWYGPYHITISRNFYRPPSESLLEADGGASSIVRIYEIAAVCRPDPSFRNFPHSSGLRSVILNRKDNQIHTISILYRIRLD